MRTPLSAALIYSSVHNSLICELGAVNAVKGVCDAQYIHERSLKKRIADGAVMDCGNSMSPDIERIISLSPDGPLSTPPPAHTMTVRKAGQSKLSDDA